MKKINDNSKKMLTGALIGAAIGVAAGILVESKYGKKITKGIKEKSGAFFEYLSPQLKQIKKLGEAEYKAFVKKAAERYSKDKKLSVAEAKRLAKEAENSWKHLKDNL